METTTMPEIPAETKHNHKSNFGRYVAGCAACTAKYPDGPPAPKGRTRKPAPQAIPAPTAGNDELIRLLLAKEAKAAQKEAEEERRMAAAREDSVRVASEEIRNREARQAACTHTKENGVKAIYGQVHSDGLKHPICIRCFKAFEPYRPVGEEAVV